MTNIYHILYKKPAYTKKQTNIQYEELANKLVNSGLLRVDADDKKNFTNFLDPEISRNITVSKEELSDELIFRPKQKLQRAYEKKYAGKTLKNKVEKALNHISQNINKNLGVSYDLRLKLSRLLVQAAHPIVIKWILLENVEVFISYSHTIGDVMDVVSWQRAGQNSGMQQTYGDELAVFISCGGDPFHENQDSSAEYGDGFPAMARLQVIAGQELGHYADIIRDENGRHIARHSADYPYTAARENVKKARKDDIKNCELIYLQLNKVDFSQLLEIEQKLKFYAKNKVRNLKVLFLLLFFYIKRFLFFYKIEKEQLFFIKIHKKYSHIASIIDVMIKDMEFNLDPQADVYERDDAEEQEAIKCIEALARIPQQVMKWGHYTTKAMMPNLYHIYYARVIPSLIESYQTASSKLNSK